MQERKASFKVHKTLEAILQNQMLNLIPFGPKTNPTSQVTEEVYKSSKKRRFCSLESF